MPNSLSNKVIHLSFKRVTEAHKKTILAWFSEEHVKEFFYGDGVKNTLRNLDLSCQGLNNNGSYSFYHWIAFCNNVPFAFIMTAPVSGPYDANDDYRKWYRPGAQTFTLDLLIGAKKFLGQGLATKMIQQFIITQYCHADFFIIDPEAHNKKAIHVYEKAGFKKIEAFYPSSNPKPHVMLRLAVNELKNQLKDTAK